MEYTLVFLFILFMEYSIHMIFFKGIENCINRIQKKERKRREKTKKKKRKRCINIYFTCLHKNNNESKWRDYRVKKLRIKNIINQEMKERKEKSVYIIIKK